MLKESRINKRRTKTKSSQKLIDDKVKYSKFIETQTKIIRSLSDIVYELPEKNCQYRIITQKRFNGFSLLKWIADKLIVKEIFVTSYRIDEQSIKGLIKLLDSNIEKVTILMSSFFTSTKKKEKWAEYLIEQAKKDKRIKVIFCHNHTKLVGIKDSSGKCYIIEGSGNMTGNARIEQYLIEQSNDMFYFHKSWIDEVEQNATELNAIIIN